MKTIYTFLFCIITIHLSAQTTDNSQESEIFSYPIHKRCFKKINNKEREQCSKQKVINFIKLSFNTELADRLFPQDKSTTFQVDFIINKKGKVENIRAKAYKKEIAAEAIRVLKRLPKFKVPGYKNGKPVNVPFSLQMEIFF